MERKKKIKNPIKRVLNESFKSSVSHFDLSHHQNDSMKDIHFKYPDSDQKRGQILEKETITKKESSRKMKIDEYTHDFQLTYGSSNKKLASESLKQSRNVDNNIRKHKENKLLCEKQNFNYYRDGGIGKVSIS